MGQLVRQPGMRRHSWKRMADAEKRIKELAGQMDEGQLKAALATITDDVVRRAVARRIFDLTNSDHGRTGNK